MRVLDPNKWIVGDLEPSWPVVLPAFQSASHSCQHEKETSFKKTTILSQALVRSCLQIKNVC